MTYIRSFLELDVSFDCPFLSEASWIWPLRLKMAWDRFFMIYPITIALGWSAVLRGTETLARDNVHLSHKVLWALLFALCTAQMCWSYFLLCFDVKKFIILFTSLVSPSPLRIAYRINLCLIAVIRVVVDVLVKKY